MNLQERIALLSRLGAYMLSDEEGWLAAKDQAFRQNAWFIPEFTDQAVRNIASLFLQQDILEKWSAGYSLPRENPEPKKVGIVMAGNIPLVGFHDWLCVFISGHIAMVKPSAKDKVLFTHLMSVLNEWDERTTELTVIREMLKDCDAYIATGSNNSAGFFDYYFGKYPHIIRRNRSSVALLTGNESPQELELLADDIMMYFGLGCRNVTKLLVPEGYEFVPLIEALKKYDHLGDHNKNKNNYDYNLALHILNNQFYMSTQSLLLVEKESIFSPISQLNYSFYTDAATALREIQEGNDLQCLVGHGHTPFGQAQFPAINDYADGVDTLGFLTKL
ncbi:MAG: acyl-CoA reductase [Chitinophagaceae bacterium]|nr:MAG: acyl-CoA reductase [Chitinophagaceae bacterium]